MSLTVHIESTGSITTTSGSNWQPILSMSFETGSYLVAAGSQYTSADESSANGFVRLDIAGISKTAMVFAYPDTDYDISLTTYITVETPTTASIYVKPTYGEILNKQNQITALDF